MDTDSHQKDVLTTIQEAAVSDNLHTEEVHTEIPEGTVLGENISDGSIYTFYHQNAELEKLEIGNRQILQYNNSSAIGNSEFFYQHTKLKP